MASSSIEEGGERPARRKQVANYHRHLAEPVVMLLAEPVLMLPVLPRGLKMTAQCARS